MAKAIDIPDADFAIVNAEISMNNRPDRTRKTSYANTAASNPSFGPTSRPSVDGSSTRRWTGRPGLTGSSEACHRPTRT